MHQLQNIDETKKVLVLRRLIRAEYQQAQNLKKHAHASTEQARENTANCEQIKSEIEEATRVRKAERKEDYDDRTSCHGIDTRVANGGR